MKDYLIRNALTLVSIVILYLALSGVAGAIAFANILWWIYVLMSPFIILGSLALMSAFSADGEYGISEKYALILTKSSVLLSVPFSLLNVFLMTMYGWVYIPVVTLISLILVYSGFYMYTKKN